MSLLRHHQLLMSGAPAPAGYESTWLIARNTAATPRYAMYAVPGFTTLTSPALGTTTTWYHPDSTSHVAGYYTEIVGTGGVCHVRRMSDHGSVMSVNPAIGTRTCGAVSPERLFVGGLSAPYGKMYLISDGSDLTLPTLNAAVFAAEFSPDGTKLAICGGFTGAANKVSVWDVTGESPSLLWGYSADFAGFYGVSWAPDSNRLAFVEYSYSRGLLRVDVAAGTSSFTQDGTQWYGVEWASSDNDVIIYGGSSVRVIDPATWGLKTPLPDLPASGMTAGATSADGKYFAVNTAGTEQFRVYDLQTWLRVSVPGALPSGSSSVRSLIFDAVPA